MGLWQELGLGFGVPEPSGLEVMGFFPGTGSADYSHPWVSWEGGGLEALLGETGPRDVAP